MENTIVKTSQSGNMPLSPVGHDKPVATTHTASNGETRAIDSGAKLVDDRPYSQIFAAELAAGNLDQYVNANQVNKHLQSLKGASAPCTYLVNDRAHKYYRENGKWLARSEEWLAANPYVAGTRAYAAKKAVGRLSDPDLETLKGQIKGQETAYNAVDDTTKAVLLPILEGLKGKLAAHEKAVREEALTAEKAKARTNAEAAFRRVLLACDRAGVDWQEAAHGFMSQFGTVCNLDPDVLNACLWTITPAA